MCSLKDFSAGRPLVSQARLLASLQYNSQIKKSGEAIKNHSCKNI
jgi:hypothetical protein